MVITFIYDCLSVDTICHLGNFERALKWSRTAEYKSTFDSEDEIVPPKRRTKRPLKYDDSSEGRRQLTRKDTLGVLHIYISASEMKQKK